MTDLERRALLGDRQAQEECTRKGIVLACPFCGYGAELAEKDSLYSVVCKDGTCIASDIQPEYGEAMVALADWNTRPAPPVGSCKDCAEKEKATVNKKGYLICPASGMDITDYDFCSWFKPMESKENEIR